MRLQRDGTDGNIRVSGAKGWTPDDAPGGKRRRAMRLIANVLLVSGALMVVWILLTTYTPFMSGSSTSEGSTKRTGAGGVSPPPSDLCMEIGETLIGNLARGKHHADATTNRFTDESWATCEVTGADDRSLLDVRFASYGYVGGTPGKDRAKTRYDQICSALAREVPAIAITNAPPDMDEVCSFGTTTSNGGAPRVDLLVLHRSSTLWVRYTPQFGDMTRAAEDAGRVAAAVYSPN